MGSASATCQGHKHRGPQPRPASQRVLPTQPGVLRERHPLLLAQFSFLPKEAGAVEGGWSGQETGALRPQEALGEASGNPDVWLAPYQTLPCSCPPPSSGPGGPASASSPPMPLLSVPVYPLESLPPQLPGRGLQGDQANKNQRTEGSLVCGGLGQGSVLRSAECGEASAGPTTKMMLDQIESVCTPCQTCQSNSELGGF